MSYPTRYELDAYGIRTQQFDELESVEEQQYRLRRKARIQKWQDTRTHQQAAGDHYQEVLSVTGWAEAQPF